MLQASYEEPVPHNALHNAADGAVASAACDAAAQSDADTRTVAALASGEAASDILVSGEVVENDAGGPRLAIDVTPFDESGRVHPFDGNVSLMILSPGANGTKQSVGRWDFNAKEVHASIDPSANEPTMRFHVELPAGTAVGNSTQLWVRLVPAEGQKQLAHANVDLTRPGVFSSQTNKIWKSEESVLAASYEEPVDRVAELTESPDTPATMNEGTWATAAPGRPANLAQDLASPTQGCAHVEPADSAAGVGKHCGARSEASLRQTARRNQSIAIGRKNGRASSRADRYESRASSTPRALGRGTLRQCTTQRGGETELVCYSLDEGCAFALLSRRAPIGGRW